MFFIIVVSGIVIYISYTLCKQYFTNVESESQNENNVDEQYIESLPLLYFTNSECQNNDEPLLTPILESPETIYDSDEDLIPDLIPISEFNLNNDTIDGKEKNE